MLQIFHSKRRHAAMALLVAALSRLVIDLSNAAMQLPDGIENILGYVPRSTFQCEHDGYFGDVDNDCKIFHLCQRQVAPDGRTEWRHWTYACGNQTMFNQLTLTCAFVDEAIPCKHASQFQYLNEVINKPLEPFLTDADVTSGFSYYSNRIMSDGARARAFQDSQLMAQIGGGAQMTTSEQHHFGPAESQATPNELEQQEQQHAHWSQFNQPTVSHSGTNSNELAQNQARQQHNDEQERTSASNTNNNHQQGDTFSFSILTRHNQLGSFERPALAEQHHSASSMNQPPAKSVSTSSLATNSVHLHEPAWRASGAQQESTSTAAPSTTPSEQQQQRPTTTTTNSSLNDDGPSSTQSTAELGRLVEPTTTTSTTTTPRPTQQSAPPSQPRELRASRQQQQQQQQQQQARNHREQASGRRAHTAAFQSNRLSAAAVGQPQQQQRQQRRQPRDALRTDALVMRTRNGRATEFGRSPAKFWQQTSSSLLGAPSFESLILRRRV